MPDDIRATLNAYVAAHPYAVLVAGVVDADGTNSYVAVGKNAPVRQANERTQFQIGSVTKTFTATLLAQMVLAHEVSLDDPIQRYLPPGVTAPTYQGTPITLLTLAEQRSGLPRLPGNFTPHDPTNPYAAYTVGDLYDAVRETKLTRVPGSQYEYSNFGFTLSTLLANREHTSYASLVESRILRPLDMNDTVVTGMPANCTQLVAGFRPTDAAPAWDFGSPGAAGSMESDLHDMLSSRSQTSMRPPVRSAPRWRWRSSRASRSVKTTTTSDSPGRRIPTPGSPFTTERPAGIMHSSDSIARRTKPSSAGERR